jgi:eukaryotic-like serine/threonine-protein kinase
MNKPKPNAQTEKQIGQADFSSQTGPPAELVTQFDDAPEVAAALSLPSRATVDWVREYFSTHRPELQIIEQVGEGAAGVVVKALDKKLDRFVAIKVLHRDWADRLGGDALSREAVAASLSSDHVVRVYEISSHQSPMLFIIMEWIDGPSLRDHLSQLSALNAREAALFAFHITTGLAAAQRRNIVHGDIKPANVMLEPLVSSIATTANPSVNRPTRAVSPRITESESFRAKLADFGLARRVVVADRRTVTDHTGENSLSGFAGTPAYASPEQLLHGQPASQLSDVWAVGATLYQMLCGVPPYTGRPHAIIKQMRLGTPLAPRQLDARIPRDLESICMKALSSAASQRYASATDLAEDLDRFLKGLPVVARPVRWPGRLVRLVRRRPLSASLLISLFLALLVGAIASNHFRLRAVGNLNTAILNSQIATQERDKALTVIQLLKSMISAGDANFGNPDIKVIDALKGLEARLELELRGQPGIESEVRSSLGSMYFSVAAYQSAFEQFQKAIELRGAQSVDNAQLLDRVELANTLRWLYQPQEALKTAQHALEQANQVLGNHHPTSVFSMEVLAGCHKDLGELSEAADILQRVIELESESVRSASARSGLASVLIDQGKTAEAEIQLREAMALRAKLGLNDIRESIVIDTNLGVALAEQGKIVEALPLQQACSERASKLLGKTHDLTLGAWMNYADTLRRHGEVERSSAINLDLWQACQSELGLTHSKTLDFAESVILNHVRQRNFQEALRLADETIQHVATDLTAEDDWHQKLVGMRCSALTGLGRAQEAVPLHEQVVRHFESRAGSNSTLVLVHKNNFGLTLIEAGQFQRAEQLYRELIKQSEATQRNSAVRSLKRNLGLALLRGGQQQAARELLEAVYRDSLAAGEIENASKCQEYLSQIQ